MGAKARFQSFPCVSFATLRFLRTKLNVECSVGGGSVMDTAKAANLFTVYRDADLYDFINAPVGKGLPITQTLRPLIAIPVSHRGPI